MKKLDRFNNYNPERDFFERTFPKPNDKELEKRVKKIVDSSGLLLKKYNEICTNVNDTVLQTLLRYEHDGSFDVDRIITDFQYNFTQSNYDINSEIGILQFILGVYIIYTRDIPSGIDFPFDSPRDLFGMEIPEDGPIFLWQQMSDYSDNIFEYCNKIKYEDHFLPVNSSGMTLDNRMFMLEAYKYPNRKFMYDYSIIQSYEAHREIAKYKDYFSNNPDVKEYFDIMVAYYDLITLDEDPDELEYMKRKYYNIRRKGKKRLLAGTHSAMTGEVIDLADDNKRQRVNEWDEIDGWDEWGMINFESPPVINNEEEYLGYIKDNYGYESDNYRIEYAKLAHKPRKVTSFLQDQVSGLNLSRYRPDPMIRERQRSHDRRQQRSNDRRIQAILDRNRANQ